MKRMWVLCLAAGLLLTGCSKCGLGGRAIVEGVYLDKDAQGYSANLLVTQTEPSAEAGDLDEKILCVQGKGRDLFSALSAAEEAESRQLFYGQNELLFLSPEISGRELFETCRLLEQETRGRPNTAVYQLDLVKKEDTDWKTLLEEVRRLEEKGGYKSSLYALSAGDKGILPGISFDEKTVSKTGILLCDEEGIAARWTGPNGELAALLGQQRRDLFLELPLSGEKVRFRVRSPRLAWQVRETQNGPQLKGTLYGRIDHLISSEQTEQDQLIARLNREIEARLGKLSQDSFEAGKDVFGFAAWFQNENSKETRELSRKGTLEQAGRVEFESRLYHS